MESNRKETKLQIIPKVVSANYLDGFCENPQKIDYMIKNVPAEGYTLEIKTSGIEIGYSNESGKFYALETLEQLANQFEKKLPCLSISDNPRFSWRGLHLDVSRHFYPVATIKKLLTAMAKYKLNRFHWHLTDDQGWRIPIKKYPKLEKISSQRIEEDGSTYSGCYTLEEIREVVEYAGRLFIEVIPEIELPGHTRAVLAAYPELSCTKQEMPVPNNWGVFEDVFCPGKDTVLKFLKGVLEEVTEMFPSQYLHIGGDECPFVRWKECPDCQERIKQENLKTERDLQDWFINKIADFLISKGKIPLGWDEIISDTLNQQVGVMIWRGDGRDAQRIAFKENRKMILSPNFYCYFDWKQTTKDSEKGAFGVTALSKTYSYEPFENDMPFEELTMGIQGNVWTERIITEKDLFYMTFPRAFAIAEIGWSEDKSDFDDFSERAKWQIKRLHNMGIDPCMSIE